MKKLLLLMLGMLMTHTAFARDFTYTYQGKTLTYTVISEDDKTVETKRGTESGAGNKVSGTLIIPATVKDGDTEYSVTSIALSSFESCTGLTSVTIPNSITSIGSDAFYGCTGLKSVTIPNSITSIGNYAFSRCTGLTSVVIPNSVSSIGNHAFFDCSGLTSVTIGESVKTIGDYAFFGCSGLKSVTIGNSVTSIGSDAFCYCSGLTKAEFASIESLCSIEFGGIYANPLYYAHNLYIDGKEVTYLVIPESVKSIGNYAFSGCTGLTSMTFGNSVETIGGRSFFGCTGLTSVTIPNSVKTIADEVFSGCTGLTSVTIGESVKTIGESSFSGCTGLTEVVIPNKVTSIGRNAFSGCTSLEKTAYPNTLTDPFPSSNWRVDVAYNPEGAIIENGIVYGSEKKTIYYAPLSLNGEYVIPEGVDSIGNNAFRICTGLTSVVIPNSVSSIDKNAFRGCSGLTSVTIPNLVTSIGNYAFDGCNGLTKVNVNWDKPIWLTPDVFNSETYNNATLNIPANAVPRYISTNWWKLFKNHTAGGYAVKDYSDDVFNYVLVTAPENQYAILVSGNYSEMTTANIPERFTDLTDETNPVRYFITSIGPNAFKNCTKLIEINFNSRSIINSIESGAFESCTGLKSIALPQTVTSIGSNAFEYCKGLTSVKIGESVKTIGVRAFYGCTGLTKAEFASIESLCSIEFGDNYANPLYRANHLYIDGKEITDLVIPESVTSIGSYAFAGGGGLKSVTIPNSVTSIGRGAFYYCTGLKSMTIPESVTSIGNDTFYYCTTLKSVTIPTSVESIGNSAFYYCFSLPELTIPNSVTSIGSSAFSLCYGLTSVTLLDGEEIEFGDNVFNNTNIKKAYIGRNLKRNVLSVSKLETLTIGNTVTEIPASGWKDAKILSTLTLGCSIKSIGDEAFSGCNALKEVIVPPSVETIGASAFAGNTALASIIMGHSVKTIGEKAYDGCAANTVSITAQTPPTAPNNTFSNYTGKLYLQGQNAVKAYYDAYTCWDRFDSYAMIEPTEMKYDGDKKLSGKPGETVQLKATLMPENVTLPQIFWRSTNPQIATVDQNGLVTIHADLNEVMMYTESDNDEGGACKIIAESLYANGPVLEVEINVNQSGIDDIISDDSIAGSEIDFNALYEVYNLSGIKVGNDISILSSGIYIVRQGKVVKKFVVK